MKRVASLVWALAVIGGCVAQDKPRSDAPVANAKTAAVPSFTIVVSHAVPDGGACALDTADGGCESVAHWQAEVTVPGGDKPIVVRVTRLDDLLRVLRDANKEKEDVGPSGQTFFANDVLIRASVNAPFDVVQRVIQACGTVGLYKTEVSAIRASSSKTEAKGGADKPAAPAAAPAPAIDAALRAHLVRPEAIRIAVFFGRANEPCVRQIGTMTFPCDAAGDEGLRAILRAAVPERVRSGLRLLVVIDAVAAVPWGRITDLMAMCREENIAVIEFAAGRDHLPEWSQAAALKKAFVDGRGEGWRELRLADFVNVNGDADTWTEVDGVIVGTGKPLGGARSKQQLTNFELVLEWKHHEFAGNSGVFVWCPESAFTDLPRGTLPRSGIEVQVLDLGYEEQWLKEKGKRSDWFTSHGDVFPVGDAKMQPFTPQITYELPGGELVTVGSDKSSRCFPTKRLTKPKGEWNHYYIRAINGEIRLWVNGEEVSGGTKCNPARGYLALEAEGAPIEFRNLRIRELP